MCNIGEVSMAIVFEQSISTANCSYKQILIAIVVNIGKCRGHTDSAGQPDSSFLRDVLELAVPQVLPKLVPAHLIDEVDVVQAVAVDIGHRHPTSMVIVAHTHVFCDVIQGLIFESDSAFFDPVLELELMEHLELTGRFQLSLFPRRKGISTHVLIRKSGTDCGIDGYTR